MTFHKRSFYCSLFVVVLSLVSPAQAGGETPLSLELIFSNEDFQDGSIDNVQWLENEEGFYFSRRNSSSGMQNWHFFDVAKKTARLVISGDELKYRGRPIKPSWFRWAKGEAYLLVRGPLKLTWDGRHEAAYYLYNARDRSISALADEDAALRNVQLSPDGRFVGYVRENNLYITGITDGQVRAVTSDGDENIFNGFLDYGSTMFGDQQAWYWSPDSRKIAFWRMDATDVNVYYMVDELGKYNTVRPMKFPNTGDKHAIYAVGVYDLGDSTTTWMDIGHDADDYIPRIHWTRSAGKLALQQLTRDHEKLTLWLTDTSNGNAHAIASDSDTAWVDITNDLLFLGKSDRFAWTSEKSGYRHAYLYDYAGNETRLTTGEWEITSLIGVDENNHWLYFYAKKDSFIDQLVYRVSLDGGPVEKVSDRRGWYRWQLSPTGKYAIETWSDANSSQEIRLRLTVGGQVAILADNKNRQREKYSIPHKEFLKFKTRDGILVDGFMIKPPAFDPAKKYPAIGYGYGNAGSQVVINGKPWWPSPKMDFWHAYMAQQGYIIFGFDNRTTAGRGKKAKNLTYGHYAKWAIADYLEGVDYLERLSYIDPSRLGFWGWSGGGYLAAALMTKGAPHFKTAVSVAPVIDLSRYQAVGVERWMDFIEDNPEGYREVNLVNFADRLQGKLLLIHGTGDENVKYAFTLQFAEALVKHDKQFDMMIYPNQHHDILDYQQHVFTTMTRYFLENL